MIKYTGDFIPLEFCFMDESSFHEHADSVLEAMVDAIEVADESMALEVDLLDGVLTIVLPDGNEIVINKHEPTGQIWLSSPVTGSSKFSYDEIEDEWQNSSAETIESKLTEELENIANISLDF